MKNKITIIGHVGSVRPGKTENNLDVLGIDLAINRKVGDKEYVDWVKVKVWGVLAVKLAPHIQKGDKLLVSGRAEAKGYLRKDGTAGADLVVHANNVEFFTARQAPVDNSSEDENN
jgi:single-strand DNA-binding protein